MARLVSARGLGVVAKDFRPATRAQQLNALDAPTLGRYKAAAHRAADALCWEAASRVLRDQLPLILPGPYSTQPSSAWLGSLLLARVAAKR
jgi:hypothetical protein